MKFGSFAGRFPALFSIRPSILALAIATELVLGAYISPAGNLLKAEPQMAAAAAVRTAPVPACTPTAQTKPTELDLTNAPAGLTVHNDADNHYQIYGNTAAQLQTQIRQCAPSETGNGGAAYTGETGYTITWEYLTVSDGSTCHLTDIKVGLHTVTTMPLWQPTEAATPGLRSQWQNFMNSLTTHEAGHATLDKQYAQQIVSDLNALQPMACNRLETFVDYLVNSDVATLNVANANYDRTTNHGATQGAILPSN